MVELMTLSRRDLATVCEKFPEFGRRIRRAQIRLAVTRGIVYYGQKMSVLRASGVNATLEMVVNASAVATKNASSKFLTGDIRLTEIADRLDRLKTTTESLTTRGLDVSRRAPQDSVCQSELEDACKPRSLEKPSEGEAERANRVNSANRCVLRNPEALLQGDRLAQIGQYASVGKADLLSAQLSRVEVELRCTASKLREQHDMTTQLLCKQQVAFEASLSAQLTAMENRLSARMALKLQDCGFDGSRVGTQIGRHEVLADVDLHDVRLASHSSPELPRTTMESGANEGAVVSSAIVDSGIDGPDGDAQVNILQEDSTTVGVDRSVVSRRFLRSQLSAMQQKADEHFEVLRRNVELLCLHQSDFSGSGEHGEKPVADHGPLVSLPEGSDACLGDDVRRNAGGHPSRGSFPGIGPQADLPRRALSWPPTTRYLPALVVPDKAASGFDRCPDPHGSIDLKAGCGEGSHVSTPVVRAEAG